jgi:pilus assembly protein CpaF
LAALGALAGMGQDAVRLQVASAIDAVVHVERSGTGRQVASIGIMEAQESGLAVIPALEILRDRARFGPAWPRLADRLGLDPAVADGTNAGAHPAPEARPPGSGAEYPQSWTPR